MRAAVIAVLASPCFLLGATEEHPPSELIGLWRGTSICTDRVVAPACKDEVVVYEFSAGTEPGTVHWKADKVVDDKREPMGESELAYDPGDECWRSEFKSPRVHVVWCLTVADAKLKGSAWMLPGKQTVRKVEAERK